MIELDEKDIRAVGKSRWIRKHEKQMSWVLIIGIVAFLGLAYLTRSVESPLHLVSMVPVFGLLGYMIGYIRNLSRAEKQFLKEWNKGK